MRILLVDDHLLFGECLRSAIEKKGTIIIAKDIRQANFIIETSTAFDLILLDLDLPDGDGLSFFYHINQFSPPPPVIVLSGTDTAEVVENSRKAGAKGFIHKSAHAEQVLTAIERVVTQKLTVWPDGIDTNADPTDTAVSIANDLGITRRQLEVLVHLETGLSNKEIADDMQIAEATVKSHCTALFQILAVKNRNACVRSARQLGLVI